MLRALKILFGSIPASGHPKEIVSLKMFMYIRAFIKASYSKKLLKQIFKNMGMIK